ncbi:hypothetical protein [Chamaesiphon minutus]|nr:hypothetical protein [Chamaesiphon minutus]
MNLLGNAARKYATLFIQERFYLARADREQHAEKDDNNSQDDAYYDRYY